MIYDTLMLSDSDGDIARAAELLGRGETAAMPTETVYGLAANALDSSAVEKIFAAKGRPQDNPLIVHIGELDDIYKYVTGVPRNALLLAKEFWPGPLTLVLPKDGCIPDVTSGGLDTVGIRFPAHPAARKLINACGFPLAAPSANLSGKPSPTSAKHVYDDMKGRIPAIIDGGDCAVGVESTVVSFDGDGRVCLLRPGFISIEDIRDIVGEENAYLAKGVTEEVADGERVRSPGMKYKHYSPKANVTVVCGEWEAFAEFARSHEGEKVCFLLSDSEAEGFPFTSIAFGNSPEEQAKQLFSALRKLDDMGMAQVYVRCPSSEGVGLAVYNRLMRAAGFEVMNL